MPVFPYGPARFGQAIVREPWGRFIHRENETIGI